jgi:membrane-bound lytic murein transglycosylase F
MAGLSPRARQIRAQLLLIALLLFFLFNFVGAARISDLKQVQTSGVLHVLTIDGPTTYFEDGRGKNGFEYLLAKAFADSLGASNWLCAPNPL